MVSRSRQGVILYIEGGGDKRDDLHIELRRGFKTFLERAGVKGKMPRLVAGSGRQQTYELFCTGVANGELAFLLVDAEEPVRAGSSAWEHVRTRKGDGWVCPEGATDEHLFLMVQVMETWFFADLSALRSFFPGLLENQLPNEDEDLERIAKSDVEARLQRATKPTAKGSYHKGKHSFKLLATLDPTRVAQRSRWARRFLDRLRSLPQG